MEDKIVLVQSEPRGPSQLVEIPVPLATQKQKLPDTAQLRSMTGQDIIIKSIRLVTFKVLPNAMLLASGNAPLAELRKICLVLYSEGWEKGQMIPLLMLNNMADADAATATTVPFNPDATYFSNWRNVDWAQSYLLYSNGTPAANTPYVVMFDVLYEKLNMKGNPIMGPS